MRFFLVQFPVLFFGLFGWLKFRIDFHIQVVTILSFTAVDGGKRRKFF